MNILSATYSYFSYNYQKYMLNKKWHIQSSPEVEQNFILPENIVYHLRRNATNPLVLMNLQRTCKYFASYYKIVELRGLKSQDGEAPWERTMTVNVNNKIKEITEKQLLTWPVRYSFTGKFVAYRSSIPLFSSKLISKACISNASQIHLMGQILTFKEYKFLTINAFYIDLFDCQVFDDDKEVVPVPRLIPWDSGFKGFHFCSKDAAYFPREAFQEMASKTLSLIRKITLFLRYLPPDFDPILLVEFLMNNQSQNLWVILGFDPMNDQIARNMQKFVDEQLKDLPEEKKPDVNIRVFF